MPKVEVLAELVLALAPNLPDFHRETEYIALVEPGVYTFYHGNIGSTDTSETVDVQEFESVTNEYVIPQSTAKWAKWHRDSYAVGSLSRFKLSADYLLPGAKKAAKALGLEKGCHNPYMNSVAQVVESVQVIEHALQLIDELLTQEAV